MFKVSAICVHGKPCLYVYGKKRSQSVRTWERCIYIFTFLKMHPMHHSSIFLSVFSFRNFTSSGL